MWKASLDSWGGGGGGGGMLSHSLKYDVYVSSNISIWIFGMLFWKSFFQYNEIFSTSKLPFYNPLHLTRLISVHI